MIAALLIGLLQGELAPQSRFGQFVSTGSGRLILVLAGIVAGALIEKVLGKLGVVLVRPHNSDSV
jgi:uncharacterized membrane protein YeaQ/YmgE (transglycosylase-associated protein family)